MTPKLFQKIIITIMVVVLMTSLPSSSEVVYDETFVVRNELNSTSAEIAGVEENGVYRTILEQPSNSASSVSFELGFPIPGNTETTTVNFSDSNREANGTISPGQTITFTHQVETCTSDIVLEEHLDARTLTNDTQVYLQFTIVIDEVGEDTCGGQQSGI